MLHKLQLSKIVIALASILMLSCQTHTVTIESSPSGAGVFVLNPERKEFEKIGVTPLTVGSESLPFHFAPKEALLTLRVAEDGYVLENYIIDASATPMVHVHARLQPLATNAASNAQPRLSADDVNLLASKIQSINKLIDKSELDEALQEARSLTTRYAEAYFLWDLMGSIYVLRQEPEAAVESYRRSLALFPENSSTKRALQLLEETL